MGIGRAPSEKEFVLIALSQFAMAPTSSKEETAII
jgi:hypothetical protein